MERHQSALCDLQLTSILTEIEREIFFCHSQPGSCCGFDHDCGYDSDFFLETLKSYKKKTLAAFISFGNFAQQQRSDAMGCKILHTEMAAGRDATTTTTEKG